VLPFRACLLVAWLEGAAPTLFGVLDLVLLTELPFPYLLGVRALLGVTASSFLCFDGVVVIILSTCRAIGVGVTFCLGAAITLAVVGRAGLAAAAELYLFGDVVGRFFAAEVAELVEMRLECKAFDGAGLRYFYDSFV